MYKILLAEAEPLLSEMICSIFAEQDFQVDQAEDGLEAYELARQQSYDAVILDRTLGKFNALDLCKHLRGAGSTAALFIINAADTSEHEAAVELGADDCLPGPVHPRELSAKVRAVIRRRRTHGYVDRLVCGSVWLDTAAGTVSKNGTPMAIRPMEYVLLEFLMRNQNRVFSAEQLWKFVWKRKGAPSDTVRAHINMLRRKLQDDAGESPIRTIKGRGYKLEAQ